MTSHASLSAFGGISSSPGAVLPGERRADLASERETRLQSIPFGRRLGRGVSWLAREVGRCTWRRRVTFSSSVLAEAPDGEMREGEAKLGWPRIHLVALKKLRSRELSSICLAKKDFFAELTVAIRPFLASLALAGSAVRSVR